MVAAWYAVLVRLGEDAGQAGVAKEEKEAAAVEGGGNREEH